METAGSPLGTAHGIARGLEGGVVETAYIDLSGASTTPAGCENPYAGELSQPAAPIAEISQLP